MTFGEALSHRRKQRGWSQEKLAQHLGITRQSLIALEHGRRSPSLKLAMDAARIFDTSLDDLIQGMESHARFTAPIRWIGAQPTFVSPVVWAFIQHAVVLIPTPLLVTPRMPDAIWDPTSQRLTPLPSAREAHKVILVGGCDPFLDWLQHLYELAHPGFWLEAVRLSSQKALAAFQDGLLHIAGSHLFDPTTKRYNQITFSGDQSVIRQHYLQWEEGLIRHPDPSAVKGLAIREPGSEANALYHRHTIHPPWLTEVFYSHQSILDYIVHHPDWAGVGLGSLAAIHGLDFEPWALESYDLFIRQGDLPSAWAENFLPILHSLELKRLIEAIPHLELAAGLGSID
ncbi:MAG: helix-turn-helix domain-containing protein [Firmicutes bacterium]|jgi:DNA-binding XRE family transcriptional regulator/molybdate-binding protein|nr:helix-turn-helix domain-containing protein [Bacillota bacterium]